MAKNVIIEKLIFLIRKEMGLNVSMAMVMRILIVNGKEAFLEIVGQFMIFRMISGIKV